MKLTTAPAAIVTLVLSAGPACGDIVTLTDGTAGWNQLSGPVDLSLGQTESNTELFIFQEQRGLTLANDLTVDTTGQGTFDDIPGGGTISAGTFVDSYIIHMDLVGTGPGSAVTFEDLVVEFDTPILGLIGTTALLDGSDTTIGDPSSTYLPPPVARGTWENGLDSFTVNGNVLTINAMLIASGTDWSDQIRVVTAGTPEPSSLMMGCVALCGFGIAARRRRRQSS